MWARTRLTNECHLLFSNECCDWMRSERAKNSARFNISVRFVFSRNLVHRWKESNPRDVSHHIKPQETVDCHEYLHFNTTHTCMRVRAYTYKQEQSTVDNRGGLIRYLKSSSFQFSSGIHL